MPFTVPTKQVAYSSISVVSPRGKKLVKLSSDGTVVKDVDFVSLVGAVEVFLDAIDVLRYDFIIFEQIDIMNGGTKIVSIDLYGTVIFGTGHTTVDDFSDDFWTEANRTGRPAYAKDAAVPRTWDPNFTSTRNTLSPDLLKATNNSNTAGTSFSNRFVVGRDIYAEFTPTVVTGTNLSAGIGQGGFNVDTLLGTTADSLRVDPDGKIYVNSSMVLDLTTAWGAGDILRMAFAGYSYGLTDALAWFAVNGAIWNNNGSANPATKVGGIHLASVITGYLGCSTSKTGDAMTLISGISGFSYAQPVGFGRL